MSTKGAKKDPRVKAATSALVLESDEPIEESLQPSQPLPDNIEALVKTAVQTALNSFVVEIRELLANTLKETEQRITRLEQRFETLENRTQLLDVKTTEQKYMTECIRTANEIDQRDRLRNFRLRAPSIHEGANLHLLTLEILRDRLQLVDVREEELESVRLIRPRKKNMDAQLLTAQSSTGMLMVRLQSLERRNQVLRNRRLLKGTKITITEDLTGPNLELLKQLQSDARAQSVWSWGGRIFATSSTGKKVMAKLFMTNDEIFADG